MKKSIIIQSIIIMLDLYENVLLGLCEIFEYNNEWNTPGNLGKMSSNLLILYVTQHNIKPD